jgi:hypothetical protein
MQFCEQGHIASVRGRGAEAVSGSGGTPTSLQEARMVCGEREITSTVSARRGSFIAPPASFF